MIMPLRIRTTYFYTVYVHNKKIACEKVGILCEDIHIDEEKDYTITEMKIIGEIQKANRDDNINGINVGLFQRQATTANKLIDKGRREKMKEVTEILRLLAKAIEQNTINTYQEQGSAAADIVFHILEDVEKQIDVLDHKTEKGGEQE